MSMSAKDYLLVPYHTPGAGIFLTATAQLTPITNSQLTKPSKVRRRRRLGAPALFSPGHGTVIVPP